MPQFERDVSLVIDSRPLGFGSIDERAYCRLARIAGGLLVADGTVVEAVTDANHISRRIEF